MIRLFLLASGVLTIAIALLINRSGDDAAQIASAEVTRAGTATGLALGDLAGRAPEVRQAPVTASGEAGSDDGLNMDAMIRSIVSEYRRPVTGDRLRQAASGTGGTDDEMRALTDGVLAGLGVARAADTPAPGPKSLNALIVQAMREGLSDAYVDAIQNEAVGTGAVAAPEALVTSSGGIDTATLLDSLVQRSVAPQPAPQTTPQAKPKPAPQARRQAAVTKPAPLPEVAPAIDEVLTYVVQPGDSLAGIALRHYGTTTAYEIIYQANRDQLPSPGAVRPGMRLTIPAL
ncbi:MAG: LysM peptidoglycan-binding domain-containing protein [Rhodobacteraceae bacterium]|nr:MAG: LysM peptidoglycan-binding domain-containing protein [Paracoccaceae bacterium]